MKFYNPFRPHVIEILPGQYVIRQFSWQEPGWVVLCADVYPTVTWRSWPRTVGDLRTCAFRNEETVLAALQSDLNPSPPWRSRRWTQDELAKRVMMKTLKGTVQKTDHEHDASFQAILEKVRAKSPSTTP